MYVKKNKVLFIFLIFMSSAIVCKTVNQNTLRILFLIDKFPWYTKSIIVNQITGLLDEGYDVHIYARTKQKSDKIDPIIYEYALLERVCYEQFPPDIDQYDVFICQYGDEGKRFVSIKRQLNLQGKLVTCIRGGDITNVNKISGGAYNELFEYGDLFLPVCEYFKARLISLGCDPLKVQVLHSAIDCSGFIFKKRTLLPGEPVRLVSVGRLDKEKAHDYVIKAMAMIMKRLPYIKFEYLIVGDGAEKSSLQRLASKLGISDKIKFLGWVDQEGVAQVLDASHIFVLPSVTAVRGSQEGIPNALKEAMAVGLPVISTYHSGIPELIEHGVSGFLVPEREVSSLADSIEYLVRHPERWAKMGSAGRKKIEKEFEKDKTNKLFFNMMSSLLQRDIKLEARDK